MTTDIVIVAAARTAVGKFGGSLAKTPAPELGAAVVADLLRRANLTGDQINEVILGQVLTAGSGQNPARQTVIKSGLPQSVPALTINAVCGSGLKAVMLAAQAIRDGDSEIVIAGGQESMSMSPHVLMGSRDGQRMGDWKMVDSMITAAAPSFRPEAFAAVTVPSLAKAGRNPEIDSSVVPCLGNSSVSKTVVPFLVTMSKGRISSLKRPAFCAASALFCEATANSSCCWREMPNFFATFSAVLPM